MTNISYRVMRTDAWKNEKSSTIRYEIACACSGPEHGQIIEIEYDKELNMCFITFCVDLKWSAYWLDENSKWWSHWRWRLKGAWRMLTKGYVEVQKDLVIQGQEHLNSLIRVLEEGQKHIKNEQNKDC